MSAKLQPTAGSRPGFNHNLVLAAVCVIVVAFVASPAGAQGEKRWCYGSEMRLDLVDANPWITSIQPSSGWQITALLRAKECHLLGIGVADFPPTFPGANQAPVFIMFDDPDNCPSFLDNWAQFGVYDSVICNQNPSVDYPGCVPPDWGPQLLSAVGEACPDFVPIEVAETLAWDKDETWFEVAPGRSAAAPTGPVLPVGVEEEFGPLVWYLNDSEGWMLTEVGPNVGTTADDVRYGAWERMPGLVVLADHGPGLLTSDPDPTQPPSIPGDGNPVDSDFFDPPQPREAWNLAGLFNSATYSLMGGWKETSALAHLNVPAGLFMPVVLVDRNITNPIHDDFGVLCEAGWTLYRMDGGPLTCFPQAINGVDPIINSVAVTLRVFAVDGDAPDVLVDMDYDGDIDARDARQMGLKLISPEARTKFKQYHELECAIPFDFDGNGNPGGCVLGARPGGITRPPR